MIKIHRKSVLNTRLFLHLQWTAFFVLSFLLKCKGRFSFLMEYNSTIDSQDPIHRRQRTYTYSHNSRVLQSRYISLSHLSHYIKHIKYSAHQWIQWNIYALHGYKKTFTDSDTLTLTQEAIVGEVKLGKSSGAKSGCYIRNNSEYVVTSCHCPETAKHSTKTDTKYKKVSPDLTELK